MPWVASQAAKPSTFAPKAVISAGVRRGRSLTGRLASPWIAFEVSQTIITLQPLWRSLAM